MQPSKTRNTPTAGPSNPRPARRGLVVAATAVAVCAAVVAGIMLTNNDGGRDVAGPSQPANSAGIPSTAPAERAVHVGGGVALGNPDPAPPVEPKVLEQEVAAVLAQTEQLDKTVFAKEVKAQEYEEYFIQLWDSIRAADDKFAALLAAPFETLAYGAPDATSRHDWDVNVTKFKGAGNKVDRAGWQAMVGKLRDAGYRLTEIEFHQSAFDHEEGKPARSTVSTILHLVNDKLSSRTAVRTKLQVEWSAQRDTSGSVAMYVPRSIVAEDLSVADRVGEVPFAEVVLPGGTARGLPVNEASQFLLAYDLDGDGRSELVIPGENAIFRNKGNWTFEREKLLRGVSTEGNARLHAGVIGDFNGDGLPDLLCSKGNELFLARGEAGGRFSASPPDQAVTLDFPLRGVSTLTAGDIDGDGDLDAWFGQYKAPYTEGNMPTPYYDANDGYPGALLVNDGAGRFDDRTEAAGLSAKRTRRTLAGSLVDLDGDRDLDLLVNSDFAGLDIYYNDGEGAFADVTDRVIDERHNFGMGHTFADFNLDGRLDMYTIGMSSTTARRLTQMGLGLEKFKDYQEKRPQMGYGNRMFFAGAPSEGSRSPGDAPVPFKQPTFKDDVARTGWSWGTSAPDFDNDGDPDIFVANGHLSGTTCRDYCTTYWRRDVYLASSREDAVYKELFAKHGMTNQVSWNGFEHDVLFMNEGGKSFLNVAHLMGVAFEFDSRGVISEDFNGDGKMDLVVAEQRSWDKTRHVHVLKSSWPTPYNWVGVRLRESRPGFSPLGAEVRVHTARGMQVARIVTGDSYVAQHAAAKHFGLGKLDKVEAIEVVWPNGQTTRVDDPPVNAWHEVPAGGVTAAAAAAR